MLSGISADDKTLRKVSMKHSSSSRHKQGDTLGNDKIPAYQNEILSMWRRVNLEDAKKMSPYEMQRTFQMNHSDCLDIPAVQHITNYDSSLNQVKKKAKKSGRDVDEAIGDGAARKRGRKGTDYIYANTFKPNSRRKTQHKTEARIIVISSGILVIG